jgi:RNA polymerase sigma-70 factor (ECF subfamily)
LSDKPQTFINRRAKGVYRAVLATNRLPSTEEPDLATLEACRQGDREALGRVLKQRAPMLARVITSLIGPGADVEDLLQVAMVSAVRAFPQFRGEATLDTWLQRIAINAVRSHARRKRPQKQVALGVLKEDTEPRDGAPSPERLIDDRRRLERFHHHLTALDADKRIAFLLHVVEGVAVDEIAALTGAGRFAVRSRIFWAGRALRSRAKRDPALRDLLPTERGK